MKNMPGAEMKVGREFIMASQPKEGNDPRKCGNLLEPFP